MILKGYVKLWRKVGQNPLWTIEKFTRGQAWIDIIMLANHEEGYIRKRGIKVVVKRGEMAWSERELAARWMWSRGKVRRFMDELCSGDDPFLVPQTGPQKKNVTYLYKIVKYDEYQGNGTTEKPTDGPQTGHKQYQNKNEKKKKKSPAKRKSFVPPDIKTVQDYFVENGYTTKAANTFFKFYSTGDPPWHDSHGNPVRNWKQKAIAVWFKQENKAEPITEKIYPDIKGLT